MLSHNNYPGMQTMTKKRVAAIIGFAVIAFVLYNVVAGGAVVVAKFIWPDASYTLLSSIGGAISIIVLIAWNSFLGAGTIDRSFATRGIRIIRSTKNIVLLIVFVVLISMALNSLLEIMTSYVKDDAFTKISKILFEGSIWEIALSSVAVAPICEELVFRSIFYAGFRTIFASRLKKKSAVILSAVFSAACFGFAHMNAYQFIYAFAVGILLALAYEYSGRLIVPIIIHMVANGASIIRTFAPYYQRISTSHLNLLIDGIVIFAVAAVVLLLFVRGRKNDPDMAMRDQNS